MNPDYIIKRFREDTANHSMEVLHDDGIYRHLKFSNKGSQVYRFDLITWPGWLTICGDMGTTVFSRLPDMFEFFRSFDDGIGINPGYWAEKVQSNGDKGIKEFSKTKFREAIDYHVEMWAEAAGKEHGKQLKQLREEFEDQLLHSESSYEAHNSVYHFVSDVEGFDFQDFFEHDLTDYTFHYIWQLYAIVWGIKTYDAHREEMMQGVISAAGVDAE